MNRVKLNEIDPQVIIKVRSLKKRDSDEYKSLAKSIENYGQVHPITIRYLTDEEKAKARSGAIYGIIDGHHRFDIALSKQDEDIYAHVETDVTDSNQEIGLAFQLNNSSIRMTPIEKGKVICELQEKSGLDIDAIGKDVFGLKSAMAYRCVQRYKQSIDKDFQKKRNVTKEQFNFQNLKESIKQLLKNVKDIDITDVDKCAKQVLLIKEVEKQIRMLKKLLKAPSGVVEKLNQICSQSNSSK